MTAILDWQGVCIDGHGHDLDHLPVADETAFEIITTLTATSDVMTLGVPVTVESGPSPQAFEVQPATPHADTVVRVTEALQAVEAKTIMWKPLI